MRAFAMLPIIIDCKSRLAIGDGIDRGLRKGLELQQEPLDETISIDQSRVTRTHY